MARGNYRVEEGIEILESNGTGGVSLLKGAGAPPGNTGSTADANIGSLYMDTVSPGILYRKKEDTNNSSDWEKMADASVYLTLGVAFDSENMGAYTGAILTDNQDTKSNIQELSDAIEAISGGSFESVDINAGTPTTVSTCIVDDCLAAEWEVVVFEQGSEAVKEYFKHTALHNGTSSADASSFDESTHTKLKVSPIAGLSFTTKLAGTGASQTMGLEISATAAITVKVRRTDVPS